MSSLRIVTAAPAETKADVLVVVAERSGQRLSLRHGGALTDSVAHAVERAATAISDEGSDSIRIPSPDAVAAGSMVVAVVAHKADAEQHRRAVGSVLRGLDGPDHVLVISPQPDDGMVRAVAEGALLGAYRFGRYRTDGPKAPARVSLWVADSPSRAIRAVVKESIALAQGVGIARDLVNTAPNDLPPATLAAAAVGMFEKSDVRVKVWDDRALRRGGFGGLVAVGQGSVNGPRLVRLQYRPVAARAHVALVGKGITFDSGGLSLKPAKAMEWMKADMGGAAAVLATVKVVHDWKLPVAVTGWLAVAENMPSGTAQRPGDVITQRGGTTVEVLNTDAEGRLVLADALVEALKETPDEVIDIATLTGAQLVALGSRVAGAMGNDDFLRDAVVSAGTAAGESLWPMPLPPELRPSLDSAVADMANIGDRNGGMLTAALFLKEFVPEGQPWTHLDIAGPAFNEGAPWGYTPKGGTGFGVRTLAEYLRGRGQR